MKWKLLPLMYTFEINNICLLSILQIFLYICDYIKICSSNTRSGTSTKMIYTIEAPPIFFITLIYVDYHNFGTHYPLSLPTTTIKYKLLQFLRYHFTENFIDNLPCTFHFYCPCSKCSATVRPPLLLAVITNCHPNTYNP